MAASNNSINSTNVPLTLPPKVGRCYISGGPPIEWQRAYRYYTSAATLPIALVLTIMCLAANLILMYSVLRRPKMIKPGMLIVCSLAASDLFLGTIQIHSLWGMVHKLLLEGGCTPRSPLMTLYHVGYHICFVSSIGSLMLMSVDCYLCVSRPLTYRSVVSTSRVLKVLVLLWLLVAIYTTIYSQSSSAVRNALISILSSCCAIPIVALQILTFLTYRSHNAAVADQFNGGNGLQARNAANERKIAIAVAYLLSTLVIGYFPRIVTPVISVAEGYTFNHLMSPFNTLALLGCATARPCVTYWKNLDVRRGVHKMFRKTTADVTLPRTESTRTS